MLGRATLRHVHISAGILACLDGYMNIAMEQTEAGLSILLLLEQV